MDTPKTTYELTAAGKLCISGVHVSPGDIVATIITEHPLDNLFSAVRVSQVVATKKNVPPVQPAPKPTPEPQPAPTSKPVAKAAKPFSKKR